MDLPDLNYVYLGTEYSSHANALNQDIVQVSDDVTMVKGTHTLTFGTQNEFYKFYNLFIQYLYGGYRFNSIANFNERDRPELTTTTSRTPRTPNRRPSSRSCSSGSTPATSGA